MAAKLDQPMSPSFNKMIALLPEEVASSLSKQDLIDLETLVIRELDFSFERDGPLIFLERFERLLEVDLAKNTRVKEKARAYLIA